LLITPYDQNYHAHHASFLLKLRNMNENLVNTLPKEGYIALAADDSPVALGFIRHVEGNMCLLDSYITNPESPATMRNVAINIINDSLIQHCKDSKIELIIAFSIHEELMNRLYDKGFSKFCTNVGTLALGTK
jgi:hypothetical protein